MIASHNSWSYLPPRKRWMYLVRPFSRCQDISIEKQLALGVRMFDMRIKVVDGKVYMAHGLLEFETKTIYSDLEKMRRTQNCSVRILLENRQPTKAEKEVFRKMVYTLKSKFPSILWFGGHGAHGEAWFEHYVWLPKVNYGESHASVCADGIERILPRRYARLYNKDTKASDSEIPIMIDFVELPKDSTISLK